MSQSQEERLANAVWAGERMNFRDQGNARQPVNPMIWGYLEPQAPIATTRNKFEFSLAKRRYTMGRSPYNDIVLDEKYISRNQLCIEFDPENRCATITNWSAYRSTCVQREPLELDVPYPLRDGDKIELINSSQYCWTFHSHIGQLVENPSTKHFAEHKSVLRRVLPAVQEHIRNVVCSRQGIEDRSQLNPRSLMAKTHLFKPAETRKLLAIHCILSYLTPHDEPLYPEIPIPRNDNDKHKFPTLTAAQRLAATPPPHSYQYTRPPPPERLTPRQREVWPVWALFGRMDDEGRLPPVIGYEPGPTPWDQEQEKTYGAKGHPCTRPPSPKPKPEPKSEPAPEPKLEPEAGPSRKRSRDSVDSNVSGPSDEERPSQRHRSPAPPPETPARLPQGRRLPATASLRTLPTPAAGSPPPQAPVTNAHQSDVEEEEDDDGASSSSSTSTLVNPYRHRCRPPRQTASLWDVRDPEAGPPEPRAPRDPVFNMHEHLDAVEVEAAADEQEQENEGSTSASTLPKTRKRSHDESEDDESSSSSAEVQAELASPSSSPEPAPKKRRTQQKTLKSAPVVKRETKTRTTTQPQVQPTRRSQRLATQPAREVRAPPRAAPLESVAAAKTAAKGKSKAGGSGRVRRRR